MHRRLQFKSDRSTRAKRFLRKTLIWFRVCTNNVSRFSPGPHFYGFSGQCGPKCSSMEQQLRSSGS
jgi:hypothetical protein